MIHAINKEINNDDVGEAIELAISEDDYELHIPNDSQINKLQQKTALLSDIADETMDQKTRIQLYLKHIAGKRAIENSRKVVKREFKTLSRNSFDS